MNRRRFPLPQTTDPTRTQTQTALPSSLSSQRNRSNRRLPPSFPLLQL